MKKIIKLKKQEGETPLEAIEKFRSKNLEYQNIKLGVAGRLDPMASGLLLILVDEENKNKQKYLNLDKVYKTEFLFGIETDTGDILGLVNNINETSFKMIPEIKKRLKNFKGEIWQTYPNYSTKTVKGKSLHQWAREGRINEIEIPKQKVLIKKIKILNNQIISEKELLLEVKKRIKTVKGDFRQNEILKKWVQKVKPEQKFLIISLQISCSSGTYIRALARDLGRNLKTGAIAYKINRSQVGPYKLDKSSQN